MSSQEREPRPVGSEQVAWVRLLARARKAENTARALRAENTALRAAQAQQEEQN